MKLSIIFTSDIFPNLLPARKCEYNRNSHAVWNHTAPLTWHGQNHHQSAINIKTLWTVLKVLSWSMCIVQIHISGFLHPASIHYVDGRLAARSRSVSLEAWDSGLDFFNRSDMWQAHQPRRCRDACHTSGRYDHDNIQSRDFKRFGGKTSYRLVNRGPGLVSWLTQCNWSRQTNVRE